jgi:hypothetical protein
MRCEDVVLRLDELLNGELSAAEAGEVEAHLEACEGCRGELAAARELQARVDRLPRSIEPPRDLWNGIATRVVVAERGAPGAQGMAPAGRVVASLPRRAGQGRRLTWASLMGMAAAVLMGIALVLGYTLAGKGPSQQASHDRDGALSSMARSTIDALGSGELDFDAARQELLAALEQRRDSLPPTTMTVVTESLRTIDQSIDGIAAALEENPGDPQLVRLMASARRQELDLLRRATRIAGEI